METTLIEIIKVMTVKILSSFCNVLQQSFTTLAINHSYWRTKPVVDTFILNVCCCMQII